jgi:recombinational DNA repair protein RecT
MNCFEETRKLLGEQDLRARLACALPRPLALDGWLESTLVQARTTRGIGYSYERDRDLYAPVNAVIGAIFTFAGLGLRLEGPLGQAYFQCTPRRQYDERAGRWVTTHLECVAGVGYRGLCALAYQVPGVREVEAVLVYEGDEFIPLKGTTPNLRHVPNSGGTSQRIIAGYAGLRYADGWYSFQTFRGVDLHAHRTRVLATYYLECRADETGTEQFFLIEKDKRSPASDRKVRETPWAAHGPAMLQKTILRWAAKFWHLGGAFDTAATLLAQEEADLPQGLDATGSAALIAAGAMQSADPRSSPPNVQVTAPDLVTQCVAEARQHPQPAMVPSLSEEEKAAILAEEARAAAEETMRRAQAIAEEQELF